MAVYYNIALVYETKLNDKKNAISYYKQYLNNSKKSRKAKKTHCLYKNKIEELKR